MSYHIIIKSRALKTLKELPPKDFQKVDAILLLPGTNPKPAGCKKLEGYDASYRIRSGNYSVIYSAFDKKLIVEVVAIGNRKDILAHFVELCTCTPTN